MYFSMGYNNTTKRNSYDNGNGYALCTYAINTLQLRCVIGEKG